MVVQVLASKVRQTRETFLNNDDFCIRNDECCIRNDIFCITNDEFCSRRSCRRPRWKGQTGWTREPAAAVDLRAAVDLEAEVGLEGAAVGSHATFIEVWGLWGVLLRVWLCGCRGGRERRQRERERQEVTASRPMETSFGSTQQRRTARRPPSRGPGDNRTTGLSTARLELLVPSA